MLTFDKDQYICRYFREADHGGPTCVPSRPVHVELRDDQPRLRAQYSVGSLEGPRHVGFRVALHVAVQLHGSTDVRGNVLDRRSENWAIWKWKTVYYSTIYLIRHELISNKSCLNLVYFYSVVTPLEYLYKLMEG